MYGEEYDKIRFLDYMYFHLLEWSEYGHFLFQIIVSLSCFTVSVVFSFLEDQEFTEKYECLFHF